MVAPTKKIDFYGGFIKEALIKSGAQNAQSDFSSNCIEILQAYGRMSRNFCVM